MYCLYILRPGRQLRYVSVIWVDVCCLLVHEGLGWVGRQLGQFGWLGSSSVDNNQSSSELIFRQGRNWLLFFFGGEEGKLHILNFVLI